MVTLFTTTDDYFQFITERGSLVGISKEDYPTEILAQEEANRYFQE